MSMNTQVSEEMSAIIESFRTDIRNDDRRVTADVLKEYERMAQDFAKRIDLRSVKNFSPISKETDGIKLRVLSKGNGGPWVVLSSWRPGQQTQTHFHSTWCLGIGVSGTMKSHFFREMGAGKRYQTETHVIEPETSTSILPGVTHLTECSATDEQTLFLQIFGEELQDLDELEKIPAREEGRAVTTNIDPKHIIQVDSKWLDAALHELEEIDLEAVEEGFDPSSIIAKENAQKILRELARYTELEPTVYPTEDGEVAIFFQRSRHECAVLILCDSDGGGACFVTNKSKNKRARYDDIGELPDLFLITALENLAEL